MSRCKALENVLNECLFSVKPKRRNSSYTATMPDGTTFQVYKEGRMWRWTDNGHTAWSSHLSNIKWCIEKDGSTLTRNK